ncbi:Phage-related protein%2C tail component [Enterobacter hormaechei]|uniref:host specificity protein J n=1 Tax=Enterobacter hormaechei TaxID=158836 RepID=UPI00079296C1|nr:phage tail protein [Enterobacter hormaechei]CZW81335.1 Phage-related protein%2C tail component [Enterobacter hormaechei]SAG83658.1 Phage-related protein%2C tail component [Enterobacter hormaechei]SAH80376.1 Phage-related protein%2C tail component [Enterobacter hormaechei]
MAVIRGSKGGGGGGDKGGNRGTEIASVAYMKILLALTEGEAAGDFTGKDIYLDGTPLLDDAGNENFPGVTWEWRSGTVDQDYIAGFPAVENEISVGTELKYGTPWVKSINNTQLSAVRLRLKFPNGVYKLRDSGGKDGYRIAFAIDISTDGGSYVEYGTDEADGIANAGYERSYRIDLPAATSGWQIRVRRLTENTTDGRHADISRIESMTDIVDAKLRYPHTSLLFIQFDSKLFDGRTPNVTVEMKGIIVRVPANYDPVSRTYSGTWDGTFKWAWTNNPAWIFYDLVLNKRYGLGKRITADLVDKWTLYQIAQYCDAPVSDGAGGKEARYLCDLYISQRTDAWTVLMDLANIFRGMISWSNNLLSVDADMPRELDPDFVFNKSNIVGAFNFSSTSEKTNYSSAIVTYSNPANGYQDDQASAWVPEVSNRFGFNTIELSRIGCTRESEAQRHGLYAIETNRDDNGVEFKTGLEGRIPRIGKVIGINNAPLAGRENGGRVAAASGTKVTLDRITTAKAGDTLIVNLPTGKSEGRKVKSVSGRAVTVETAYSVTPNAESAWVLDQPDLAIQLFRVKRLMVNSDNTVTINGLPYNPNKFPRVDDGAVIEDRPVSVVPPRGQSMPENITISSSYRVEQGIGITTMVVTWDAVKNAVAYEAQWRQNNGDWINVPRTGNTRFEVDGIYAGRYVVRIRAVNALDIASLWATSAETELTGKVGKPPMPVNLATQPLVFGIGISWGFPSGAQDTQKTEIHYSATANGDSPLLLADVPYPSSAYQQMGLLAGKSFWYRARLVDRLGNQSDWTEWVFGQSSTDVSDITDSVLKEMEETGLLKDVVENAVDSNEKIAGMANDIKQANDELAQQAQEIAKNAQDIGKVQTNVTNLSSTVGDVSSSLSKLEQTVATADTALGQRIDNISVSVDGMTGGVKNSAIAIIQGNLAQVAARKTLSASVAGNSAQLDRIDEVIVNEKEATARSLLSLQTDVNGNKASINSLNQTFSDYQQATATQINGITATINGHTSAITTNAQAIANVNGDLKAMYSIKVGLSSNGQYYAAGMGIGVENTPSGMQSQVIFLADRFAVTHQAGATVTLPFVIQNGQTIIRDTVIGNGTISNLKIGSYIQSTTWDGTGNVGWHINKSGYATFNNVTVRGSIYATNGNFSFNGSGNTTVINGNGVTVNIPGGGRIVLGTWT